MIRRVRPRCFGRFARVVPVIHTAQPPIQCGNVECRAFTRRANTAPHSDEAGTVHLPRPDGLVLQGPGNLARNHLHKQKRPPDENRQRRQGD